MIPIVVNLSGALAGRTPYKKPFVSPKARLLMKTA